MHDTSKYNATAHIILCLRTLCLLLECWRKSSDRFCFGCRSCLGGDCCCWRYSTSRAPGRVCVHIWGYMPHIVHESHSLRCASKKRGLKSDPPKNHQYMHSLCKWRMSSWVTGDNPMHHISATIQYLALAEFAAAGAMQYLQHLSEFVHTVCI